MTIRVRVDGDDPYDVLIGRRLLSGLPALIGDRAARVRTLAVQVPNAEKAKTAEVADTGRAGRPGGSRPGRTAGGL
ncbi:hypothetical protein [Streptomyces sp. NRRL B-3648]|uniref:hypothetical protein n=1 Tax=Streptomyces sp. NRRL B-3648 TaxID=1519493 RepID=UPI0006AE759A|nr:hypothetical protein [Streptomyces sp. NRRL B-3648]KOX07618.1 hypothetical protein ADL04_04795 [Streptomyces sp. NRRL B-3648]